MYRTIVTLCLAEALSLIGAFAFPALTPDFIRVWSLTNAEAGWIAGVFFLGYSAAVPVLSSLTDRVDAKRIFALGAAISAVATLGFALLAEGFWSAMALRFVGGIGLAGVYMPGLKALVDRVTSQRAISFYTASFGLGTMLSFSSMGEAGPRLGWQGAFLIAGGLGALAFVMALTLKPVPPKPSLQPGALLDFRPVLRNRAAMGFILGYACHNWELFAYRAWMVAFLVFARGGDEGKLVADDLATISAAIGVIASIGGADLAIRFGRLRLCILAMLGSGGVALVLGFASALPYWVCGIAIMIYTILVMLDSAALTTGAMLAAEPERRGATVALHSLLGFGASFAGPLLLGIVLDHTGLGLTPASWGLAFAVMGFVALLGPLAIVWGSRANKSY